MSNEILQRVRDGYVSGKHTTDNYISDAVVDETYDIMYERGLTDLEQVELCAEVDNSICTFLTGQEEERDNSDVELQNYEDHNEPSVDFIVKNIFDKMLAGEHYHV